MNNSAYAWNDLLRSMQEQHEMFKSEEPTLQQKLNIANSKLASIEMIMDEYYTGSFTTIEELAGEISAVVTGTEDWSWKQKKLKSYQRKLTNLKKL